MVSTSTPWWGMDRSRRIAWARYYQVNKDNERLLHINRQLLRRLAVLAVTVLECEAVTILEEDDELLHAVRMIVVTLQRSPRGAVVLREVMEERAARKEEG